MWVCTVCTLTNFAFVDCMYFLLHYFELPVHILFYIIWHNQNMVLICRQDSNKLLKFLLMWNEKSNSHYMSQYAYRQTYQQMVGNLM